MLVNIRVTEGKALTKKGRSISYSIGQVTASRFDNDVIIISKAEMQKAIQIAKRDIYPSTVKKIDVFLVDAECDEYVHMTTDGEESIFIRV